MSDQIFSHVPSADIEQATFVVLNADKTVQTAAATLAPYGINDLAATAGDITDVTLAGIAKIRLGAGVNAGQELKSDANGKAIKVADGEHTGIFARDTGSTNDIIEAFIR